MAVSLDYYYGTFDGKVTTVENLEEPQNVEDLYFAGSNYHSKFLSLFAKAKTAEDIVALIHSLCFEFSLISQTGTDITREAELLFEWGVKYVLPGMGQFDDPEKLCDYNLNLIYDNRERLNRTLSQFFTDFSKHDYTHLGYTNNPFSTIMFGKITEESIREAWDLLSLEKNIISDTGAAKEASVIDPETCSNITANTHTPPVTAAELASVLGVSKATLSNKDRPLGKLFDKYRRIQNCMNPQLPYEELYPVVRKSVRRSRSPTAEDLTLNSIEDLKDLW